MKLFRSLRLPIASLFIFSMVGIAAEEPEPGQIEFSVGKLLEQGHYTRKKLDDKFSQLLLANYLDELDYNHLYFTQKDVDSITQKHGTTLADDILLGNPDPAYKIFDLYKKRVEDRIAKVKEALKEKFTFDSDRTIEVNRQKAPWPKNEAAADELWHSRVEGEVLQEDLFKRQTEIAEKEKAAKDAAKASAKAGKDSEKADKSDKGDKTETAKSSDEEKDKVAKTDKTEKKVDPIEKITHRYDQVLRNLHETSNKEDIMKIFLYTLAQTYDPHSEYMSREELENFSINMGLKLVGIGAVLHSEDGYAQITELVPGGPAARSGKIKVGDRIRAVAQGEKDFVDTMDMKLDKVVEMIRGKKDTIVRLQVVPQNVTDPSARSIVEIKREEIKLKEQEAKAEVIEHPNPDGSVQRIGWITLPSFYADMDNAGKPGAASTTKDVLALLNRLKSAGISGLVMDLRRNGGGSLEEAVNLTGLFVKRGPVVQAKDGSGVVRVNKCHDAVVAYDGPMMVLTNRLSASASEIFAAALQDYGRALIVGDQSTFGKGTVQTMIPVGHQWPIAGGADAGALKLTIQKFYRIAGGSTQLKGVEPDVKLPSLYDLAQIGESSLKNPLPYDTVDKVPYDKWEKPLFKPELAKRSAARIAADPEFSYINEDLDRTKQRLAENRISLNEKARVAELDEDKVRQEKRTAERAKITVPEQKDYIVTLENLNKPELELAKSEAKDENGDSTKVEADELDPTDPDGEDAEGNPKKPAIDPVRNEALNIIADLVDLSKSPKPSTTTAAK